MKVKYLWVLLLSLTFFGCDDNTGTLGLGMFPGGDQSINGKLASFDVTTQSELAGKVFAKTSIGYLGKFTDPDFGYYEAGFLTQLHCVDNFKFPAVSNDENKNDPKAIMVKDGIYRTELILTYGSYFGDSLTASRLSIYQLNKDLDKESAYYTNITPEKFYDKNNPNSLLGRKAYTAVNMAISDSLRALGYTSPLIVTLPKDLGDKIYKKSREAEKEGRNFAPEFIEDILKGVYVKCDYGDGTILYVDQVELHVIYEAYVKDENGLIVKKQNSEEDSTYYAYSTVGAATKEIIQANSFKSDEDKIKEKVNETGWTYLKTPAGIYTQATLPLSKNGNTHQKGILDSLSNDTLNVVRLTLTNYNQTNDKKQFSMSAPTYVLLVREKEKESFFQGNKVNDDITSYLAQHNSSTNQYIFPNISRLINTCKAEREAAVIALQNEGKIEGILDVDTGEPVTTIEAWEKASQWDKVAILPVTITRDQNTSTAIGSIISILNDLRPGYAKLKGGIDGPPLSLEVIYTSF